MSTIAVSQDNKSIRLRTLNDVRLLEKVKELDKVCFPVSYGESYYRSISHIICREEPKLGYVALYDDILVGSITARLEKITHPGTLPEEEEEEGDEAASASEAGEGGEGKKKEPKVQLRTPDDDKDTKYRAYIMCIGVLPPYRRLGIADLLLKSLQNFCATQAHIDHIALHVQQGSDALAFYSKNDFENKGEVKEYYTDIQPTNDAFLLNKVITHVEPPVVKQRADKDAFKKGGSGKK